MARLGIYKVMKTILVAVSVKADVQYVVCSSVATKVFEDFLSKDPSLVYFQKPKNLQIFEDFRPKIAKIFWKISQYFGQNCLQKSRNMYFSKNFELQFSPHF